MKRKKWLSLLSLMMVIALMITGCTTAEPVASEEPVVEEVEVVEEEIAVETVKIGAIFPLTGGAAATGVKLKYAVETAQEIINGEYPEIAFPMAGNAGLENLDNAAIEFIFGDHQANPEIAKSETERLIQNEGVVGLVGCYHSSSTKPASATSERYMIPFVAGSSSSSALTERGLNYFVRIAPHDGMETEFFFEYLKNLNENYGADVKTIATVYIDNEYGVHANMMVDKWLEEVYGEEGFERILDVKYPSDASNVDTEVLKIKEAAPDIILHASYINDMTMFANAYQLYEVQPKVVISYCGGFQDQQFLINLEDAANYYSGSNQTIPAIIAANEALSKANEIYKAKSGVDFDGPALEDFASAMVIAEAINMAGSTDGDAIMEVLKSEEFKAPYFATGKIKFGEDGQNEFSASAMTQIIGGEYQNVWPGEDTTSDPVVAFPDWSTR
jgi:branched-chain amino acid transport system substrate-binding protein